MSRVRTASLLAFILIACALPGTAAAERGVFSFNLWAGVGGPFNDDNGGLGNSSFQAGFAVQPEEQLLVGLRLGEVDMTGEIVGNAFDTTLEYATVVGEYRFTESFYESGLYIGLGAYSLDGQLLAGGGLSEDSVGLVLGISGEFVLTDRIGFLLEFSGHLTNLDTIDTMVMGHTGIAIHF